MPEKLIVPFNVVKVMRNQTNTTKMSAAPKYWHYFTLWIKRSSCIKTHNVIILTTARKSESDRNINCLSQLVNESFKGTSYRKNTISELKSARLLPALTQAERWRRHWHTAAEMMTWRSMAHMAYLWCDVWGRRDQRHVIGLCTPFAVCSTCCSQLDLNLVIMEATVAAKWTLVFLFAGTSR